MSLSRTNNASPSPSPQTTDNAAPTTTVGTSPTTGATVTVEQGDGNAAETFMQGVRHANPGAEAFEGALQNQTSDALEGRVDTEVHNNAGQPAHLGRAVGRDDFIVPDLAESTAALQGEPLARNDADTTGLVDNPVKSVKRRLFVPRSDSSLYALTERAASYIQSNPFMLGGEPSIRILCRINASRGPADQIALVFPPADKLVAVLSSRAEKEAKEFKPDWTWALNNLFEGLRTELPRINKTLFELVALVESLPNIDDAQKGDIIAEAQRAMRKWPNLSAQEILDRVTQ